MADPFLMTQPCILVTGQRKQIKTDPVLSFGVIDEELVFES